MIAPGESLFALIPSRRTARLFGCAAPDFV